MLLHSYIPFYALCLRAGNSHDEVTSINVKYTNDHDRAYIHVDHIGKYRCFRYFQEMAVLRNLFIQVNTFLFTFLSLYLPSI